MADDRADEEMQGEMEDESSGEEHPMEIGA
jgi:hypothetical protein